MGTKLFNKKLKVKARKHDQIRMLAKSKLNTINDHVSQAMEDGTISQEEYLLISNELKKFHTMKEEIRNKIKPVTTDSKVIEEALENQKKELLQKLLNSK